MTLRDQLIAWLKDENSGVSLNGNCFDGGRQNTKRPAYLSFFVPDDWVLNARGNEKLSDTYFVLRIPRELIDKLDIQPETGDNSKAEVSQSEQ